MRNKRAILLIIAISLVIAVEGWAFLSKPRLVIEEPAYKEQVIVQEAAVNAVEVINKEEQGLELELLGTAFGNIKDPIAFIKDLTTDKQGIYKLGSKVRDAKVVKIAMGEVVLEINGRQETLRLSARGKAWAKLNGESPEIFSVSGDKILVSKKGALNEAGKIINSLRALKIKPHYVSKQVSGMMVEGVAGDSVIAAAGIHDRDVITTVNNQKIDSYQKALQVFSKARKQSDIKVSLLREGQVKNLDYHIDLN